MPVLDIATLPTKIVKADKLVKWAMSGAEYDLLDQHFKTYLMTLLLNNVNIMPRLKLIHQTTPKYNVAYSVNSN